jgi:hypothetical protein
MARLVVVLSLVFAVLYLLVALRRSGPSPVAAGRTPPRGAMSRTEALLVLGLAEGATKRDIVRAHRELIRKVHPDTPGGSTYLASQINQARDVLLA